MNTNTKVHRALNQKIADMLNERFEFSESLRNEIYLSILGVLDEYGEQGMPFLKYDLSDGSGPEPLEAIGFLAEWEEFMRVCKPSDSSFCKALRIIQKLAAENKKIQKNYETRCRICNDIEEQKTRLHIRINELEAENAKLKENTCDYCGTKLIDNCLQCGAPQCCPLCCAQEKLDRLTAENKAKDEEISDLQQQLDDLANNMIYQGNSVSYIYEKQKLYGKQVMKIGKILRKHGLENEFEQALKGGDE